MPLKITSRSFKIFLKFMEIFASQGAQQASTTPVENLPPVSITPVANLPLASATLVANFATGTTKFATGVNDPGGK
jgi:hypothetical protein